MSRGMCALIKCLKETCVRGCMHLVAIERSPRSCTGNVIAPGDFPAVEQLKLDEMKISYPSPRSSASCTSTLEIFQASLKVLRLSSFSFSEPVRFPYCLSATRPHRPSCLA